MEAVSFVIGIGELLRQARVAKGISQESLARDLRLPLSLLNAIETEDWTKVPPGRERPLTRLVARKVGLDLEMHRESFDMMPGGVEQEPHNPRREAVERLLMGAISVGSLALLAWLIVPGQGLKSRIPTVESIRSRGPIVPYVPQTIKGPNPVLGEVLPEAPITEEGILVVMRAMDTCEIAITSGSGTVHHSMRVSEPWSLRVKGAFTLTLDNAGVIDIEVAGQRIPLGKNVGESWTGSFGADGMLALPPKPKVEIIPTAPETEPEAESESATE